MRKHHTSRRSERTVVRSMPVPFAGSATPRRLRRGLTTLVVSGATVAAVLTGPTGAGMAAASPARPAPTTARPASTAPAGEVRAVLAADLRRSTPEHRRTKAQQAISFARAQLGKPYAWGGTGPGAYDCSGLTQASWRHAGVPIARIADEQYWAGKRVHLRYAKPGDLVFWSSNGSPYGIYHVGVYIGGGLMIDAPHTGARVRVDHLWGGVYPYATQP